MKNLILNAALPFILDMIKEMLTEENYKRYGQKLFALAREFVLDTETTIDDKVVLPVLDALEKAMGLAD